MKFTVGVSISAFRRPVLPDDLPPVGKLPSDEEMGPGRRARGSVQHQQQTLSVNEWEKPVCGARAKCLSGGVFR